MAELTRLRWPAIVGLIVSIVGACGGASAPTAVSGAQESSGSRVRTGGWGGDHVFLSVADDGAFIEFDCAHGRIEEPLTLDRDGRFDAGGTYVQERGGPQREGDETGRAVRYRGRVDGDAMMLTLVFGGGVGDLGPFALTYGSRGVLRKCL
jgi:hypothetical protein